jgi:hypothetical protein
MITTNSDTVILKKLGLMGVKGKINLLQGQLHH